MLCILLIVALATHHPPKVAPISLEGLALYADCIVVGHVSRVVCVGEDGEILPASLDVQGAARCSEARTIAEVAVQRVLRGDPAVARVWYFAEGTWTCDVTQAVLGERALFFLTQAGAEPAAEKQLEAEDELTGGQPLLRDAWAGRGRMPIASEDGTEWITAWDDVIPSEELVVKQPQDIPYASIYWMAPLEEVARLVVTRISSTFGPIPIHPVSGLPACVAVATPGERTIAAFWRDGTAVWSVDSISGGPPFLEGDIGTASVSAIWEVCEDRDLEPDPLSWWRQPSPKLPPFRLVLRFPGAFHDLELPSDSPPPIDVTEVWKQILGAIPEDGGRPLVQPLMLR